jgi:hypothetical protein
MGIRDISTSPVPLLAIFPRWLVEGPFAKTPHYRHGRGEPKVQPRHKAPEGAWRTSHWVFLPTQKTSTQLHGDTTSGSVQGWGLE